MKAFQVVKYGDIKDSVAINEVSKPVVGAKDVLIEVRAAGINPIEKGIVSGHLQRLLSIPLPATLGYDVSGTVVEKGDEVKTFEIGDLVYARVPQEQMGTLAEFVAVVDYAVSKKPENISFEEAAGLPLAGLTALQSLESVGIKQNDKVLIHAGSGGVGSFAVQYAKAKGAYVYTTTGTDNVDWVKELGADKVIDYKTEDYKTIVKDVDIVFDTLGGSYTLEAFQLIKQGGRVVSIMGPMDDEAATMFGMTDYKMPEELTEIIKSKNATYSYIWMHPDGVGLGQIKSMVEDGKIKPIVDKVYSFSESAAALLHLATGKAKGKIIIRVK
ncbi:MAG: NADP-dependent oxidoreductase [Ginsengibacter sp.]